MEIPKILIVDDRVENLISLEAILNEFDVEFVRALSGMDALRETIKEDFALAILDVQMPEMDGYETLSLMRKRSKTKYLPVIFVSAIHQSDLHIIKGIESGAVDFIPKPIIPEILIGKVSVFLDLYHQKQKLNGILHELELNNKELEIQKNKAEEATRIKALFLANMSHEIRTPLNGIIGVSKMLEESNLAEDQKELTHIITSSGENLLNIISDILDFSKIEAGQIQIEDIPFNLNDIICTVVKLLKFKADEKGISLHANVNEQVPQNLVGDPYRLNQIVTNLTNNAIKFTESGSVSISVDVLEKDKKQVELIFKVSDTGIGISEEGKVRLFKEFSQVDKSTTRKYGGTGLGLSICQNLVALMNGEIGVNSTLDKGSVFWFKLKYKYSSELKPKKNNEKIAIPPNLKILYAEDNVVNQRVTRFMLQKINADCDFAGDGKQAFEMFKSKKYDIVLMDMYMPELGGVESTKLIREFETSASPDKGVYIVAVTANAFSEDKQLCLDAGMNDFLSKPFKESDLMKTLKNALGN